jgi:hypothetical protein
MTSNFFTSLALIKDAGRVDRQSSSLKDGYNLISGVGHQR